METSYISRTSGIGTRDKIGYAMGDLASLLVFGLVQSVLQKYYTDVLGIGVVSIMVMFIIARVWDAINDPLWGADNRPHPARAGRALPPLAQDAGIAGRAVSGTDVREDPRPE